MTKVNDLLSVDALLDALNRLCLAVEDVRMNRAPEFTLDPALIHARNVCDAWDRLTPAEPEKVAQKGSEGQGGVPKLDSPEAQKLAAEYQVGTHCTSCGLVGRHQPTCPTICRPRENVARLRGLTSEEIIDHTKAWLDGKEGLVPHE